MRARHLSLAPRQDAVPSRRWAGPDPPNTAVPSIGWSRGRAAPMIAGRGAYPGFLIGARLPVTPSPPAHRPGRGDWRRRARVLRTAQRATWPCRLGASPFTLSRPAPRRRGYGKGQGPVSSRYAIRGVPSPSGREGIGGEGERGGGERERGCTVKCKIFLTPNTLLGHS